jgi:hypothetical protein
MQLKIIKQGKNELTGSKHREEQSVWEASSHRGRVEGCSIVSPREGAVPSGPQGDQAHSLLTRVE